MQEGAGDKAAQELAEAKRQYMQKIMSWNLPDSKAKDIIFLVHMQLRRKLKRAQHFYVSCAALRDLCMLACLPVASTSPWARPSSP